MVLTETVRRAFSLALATAPGLGAFTAAMGVLGLDGAIRLCRVRRPSAEVVRVWRELGYDLAQLPTAEDVRALLIGVEVRRAIQSARRHRRAEPAEAVARRLGHDPMEARRGLRLLDAYGAKVSMSFDEMGNTGREERGAF